MPKPEFPLHVKKGPIAGTIFRFVHAESASGYVFKAVCGGKTIKQSTQLQKVRDALDLHMSKLAVGEVQSAQMTKEDRDELLLLRKLVGNDATPLIALREWRAAKDEQKQLLGFNRIKIEDAIDEFIAAGESRGLQYERTYRAKLSPLAKKDDPTAFRSRFLDTISPAELEIFFQRWANGVTRNDLRKKATALWNWALRKEYLPAEKVTAISRVDRAREDPSPPGVCTPKALGQLLMYLRDYHPHYVAPLAVAALGVRSDEIHGKRSGKKKLNSQSGEKTRKQLRQLWSDIHLEPADKSESPFLRVTAAKINTPSRRKVPILPWVAAWLATVPEEQRKGCICERHALDRIRAIGQNLGLKLPENCFRHSYISYRMQIEKKIDAIAADAGTSVAKIHRHYRAEVDHAQALEWYQLTPEYCRTHYERLTQKTAAENGAAGGKSASPKKLAAIAANLAKARAAKAAKAAKIAAADPMIALANLAPASFTPDASD